MALKEIIGIAAGIAAAAGLAAAASKGAKKEREEQQKLQLQQELLEMERRDRQHQRAMELRENAHRQQLERERLMEEARQREHQRRLENAPKKPIYRAVPLECPKCMGHREIHRETGQAVCPYCDYVEQLVVERYVIDQEKFQKQLREERQRKAKRQNQLALCWCTVGGVILFGIPIALTMGIFSLYICWAVIAIALLLTYPKLKPILWGVIFPLPLTGFLLHNENVKQKIDAVYRYLIIAAAWIVYVGILVTFLGIDANRLSAKLASQPSPQIQTAVVSTETVAETEPAAASTRIETTAPTTEIPTEESVSVAAVVLESDTEMSDDATAEETNAESETEEKPTIAVTNHRIVTDGTQEILVIEYAFTNTFSSNRTYFWSFMDTVYQNGVECDHAEWDEIDDEAQWRSVQPGGTIRVEQAYEITDHSEVSVEVTDLLGFTTYYSDTVGIG